MFDGLIGFIEKTLFSLINKLTAEEKSGIRQVEGILSLLLGFAKKNPGMTRVLIGDALINENDRLQSVSTNCIRPAGGDAETGAALCN